MPYIYQADTWCDSCGEAIKARLLADATLEEKANWQDETCYDSDEYPKWMNDDEEADTPQHCAAGPDCLECEVICNGIKIGALLSTSLTGDGVKYVKGYVADDPDSEVVQFWKERFNWIDFDEEETDED